MRRSSQPCNPFEGKTAAEIVGMSVLTPRMQRDGRNADIARARAAGHTQQQIADAFGLTRARVCQILKGSPTAQQGHEPRLVDGPALVPVQGLDQAPHEFPALPTEGVDAAGQAQDDNDIFS